MSELRTAVGLRRWLMSFLAAAIFFSNLADIKPLYREHRDRIQLHRPNFEVHKFALGASEGTADLLSDEVGFDASMVAEQSFGRLNDLFVVPVRTIAAIVNEWKIPVPDILKIDVQGGELLVLEGAGELLGEMKVVQAEAWFERSYGPENVLFHELHEYLTNFGFVLLDIGERFYAADHRLYAFDSYFIHKSLAEKVSKDLPPEPLRMAP